MQHGQQNGKIYDFFVFAYRIVFQKEDLFSETKLFFLQMKGLFG